MGFINTFLNNQFTPLVIIIHTFYILGISSDSFYTKSVHPDPSNIADFSNQNLQKLNSHYEGLFHRLQAKDYGFASFGSPCDPISAPELEDFLDLGRLILKDQEEDGAYRRTIEEHLRPKLKYFFDRAKLHCDFQSFLICHKRVKTCGCPDGRMGVGKNGACGFNLGKRCDFNWEQLKNDLGVILIDKSSGDLILSKNVSCLGDAECVGSFGAATKICRCPAGKVGSDCRTSIYSRSSGIVGSSSGGQGGASGAQSHTIPILGRAFKGKGRAMWKPNNTETEYFLYPDEIKNELVKMMNFRGIFDPEEREKEAVTLYTKMESDTDKEEIVIMDIYLRRLGSLKYGADCDPLKQMILDNPPLALEGDTWVDPNSKEIQNWQSSLLKDGQAFCSFVEFLRCDETSKTCQCKEGLSFEDIFKGSAGGGDADAHAGGNGKKCYAIEGTGCGPDYENTFEFDPIRDLKRFSPPYSPECMNGTLCRPRPLFYLKQCWGGDGSGGQNENDSGGNPIKTAQVISEINSRFTLNINDSCNPLGHSILLNPKDLDRSNFPQRISSLNQLLSKKSSLSFCNLNKFLNCSEISKKCECFENLVEEDGACRVKNFDSCGEVYVFGKAFFPGGSKMWKVEQVFQKSFQPLCVKGGVCGGLNGAGTLIPGKCVCKDGHSGPTCSEGSRSVFASVLNPLKVQGYYKDKEINEVFYLMNAYMVEIEKLMGLQHDEKCEPVVGAMLNWIAGFYREIGGGEEGGNKTLHQYSKAVKWSVFLLKKVPTVLCNAFHNLQCHPTKRKCFCPVGSVYEDKLCKLNAGSECVEKPALSWIPSCRSNSNCSPSVNNFKSVCTCSPGFIGETCTGNYTNSTADPSAGFQDYSPIDSPPEEKIDFLKGIDEMIGPILNDRQLLLDSPCDMDKEAKLTMYFPRLPLYDPAGRGDDHLPSGPKITYYGMRQHKLDNPKIRFCDRRQHLQCLNGKCNCDESHGIVRQGGSCRLADFSFCGEINTIYDKHFPIPMCKIGSKCTRGDYGVYKCIRVIGERF